MHEPAQLAALTRGRQEGEHLVRGRWFGRRRRAVGAAAFQDDFGRPCYRRSRNRLDATGAGIFDRVQDGRSLTRGSPRLQILPSLPATSALAEVSVQTRRLGFAKLPAEQVVEVAGRGAL